MDKRSLIFGICWIVVASWWAGCQALAPSAEKEVSTRWYRGNLHTHSLWSDGDQYPEMIVDWYKQHGYDFLALSDHNIIARGDKWIDVVGPEKKKVYRQYVDRFGRSWVETREKKDTLRVRLKTLEEFRPRFEEPGVFAMFPAEEITSGYGGKPVHLNATNIKELIEPEGGSSVLEVMQNNVDAVLEQRRQTGRPMFPHINHPNFGWAITAQDLIELEGERFFEVYNGHPSVHNEGDSLRPSTERIWDVVLTKRLERNKPVMYGLATDDAHNYHTYDSKHSNPGRGWVMVRADTLTPTSVIKAMQQGRFYSTSGVEVKKVERNENTVHVAVEPQEDVSYIIQFIGTLKDYQAVERPVQPASSSSDHRSYSQEIGTVLKTVEGTTASYQISGRELYVRAKVISSKPKKNPYRPGETEVAWMQPFVP